MKKASVTSETEIKLGEGFHTTLNPYDPEDYYDIPEKELPKFIGATHVKKHPVMDKFFEVPSPTLGNPLESHRFIMLDLSDEKSKVK